MSKETARSIEELTPAIRDIVEESRFVGLAGELLSNPPHLPPIDKQMNVILATLQRMRTAGVSWETSPVGHL